VLERELGEVVRRIGRMVESIKSGVDPKPLVAEINSAQAKREALESQLRLADQPHVTELHPNAAASYRHKVAQIQEALAREDAAALKAIAVVRGLVRKIRITLRRQDGASDCGRLGSPVWSKNRGGTKETL
jgi:hypothetical protein